MRRRTMTGILVLAVLCCLLPAKPAFAAVKTVSSVTVDIRPDVSGLMPGEKAEAVVPQVTGGKAYVQSYEIRSESRPNLLSYTYGIMLAPEGGYEFSPEMKVTVKGATKVEVPIVTGGAAELTVTTYPVFRLGNPQEIEEYGDGYEWKKVVNAKKYNVITYYENEDGEEKTKSTTVKKHEINYSDSFLDKNEITGISVQAIGDSEPGYKFVIPSDYITQEGDIDYEKVVEPGKFSFPSATGKVEKNNTASQGATSVQAETGWVSSPGGIWFRNPDGSYPANGWMFYEGHWYYFNADGYLIKNNWVEWNGAWYCLDKNGKMYSNCWTPDGFYVNESGAWEKGANVAQ